MSKNCDKTTLYESLNYCKGKPVYPGIRGVIYGCQKSSIKTWPKLPDTATTNMKELAIYKGSFEMGVEAKFHRIDLAMEKGAFEFETQGEGENITYLNKLNVKHPEIDEDAAAYARQATSDDMVYVFRQRDGKWRVCGNEMFPTIVKCKGGTGEGTSGDVGTNLEISCTDVCPCPFYEGTLITAEDDTIQCGPQGAAAAAI